MKARMMVMAVGLACALALAAVAQDGGDNEHGNRRGNRGEGGPRGGMMNPAAMAAAGVLEGAATMPDAEAIVKAYMEQSGDAERALMELRRKIMQEVMQARQDGKDDEAIKAIIAGYKDQITPLVDKVVDARIKLAESLLGIAKANPVDTAAAMTDEIMKRMEQMRGRRPGGQGQGQGQGQGGQNGERGNRGNRGNRGGGNRGGGNNNADAPAAPAVEF